MTECQACRRAVDLHCLLDALQDRRDRERSGTFRREILTLVRFWNVSDIEDALRSTSAYRDVSTH